MSGFVHLHVHSEYSLLDGASRISDIPKKAKANGQKAIALTDHGVMYGVVDFYKACLEEGIKPILGCEVYTAPRGRFQKESGIDSQMGHLVLLAQNNTGYKNLMKIVSTGFTEGFYYKPRVDFEVLEEYKEGIIALSACLAGFIPDTLLKGDEKRARELLDKFKMIYKDNFYIELQDHGLAEQKRVNPMLIDLAKSTSTPVVITNDSHYTNREDAKIQDILMCIQMGETLASEDRMRFETDEFYLKGTDEMEKLFPSLPEGISNTWDIASRCDVEIDFSTRHLPKFDVPGGRDSFEYLKELCFCGLYERYKEVTDEHIKRLEFELDVIKSMGFVDYFLIVHDFVDFSRKNKIMVGPGRGSAAGSLVAYCLKITSIDPLRYNLLFERFLNPERITMPDIDIDFCYERRDEVIDYVIHKYGRDKTAQIITFGTMGARAVIRDVGRVLDVPYQTVDQLAKMIPMELNMTIDKALEVSPNFRQVYNTDEKMRELIDYAKALEGMPRHASTHAAGVVISKEPLNNFVPIQKNDDVITTQFPMTTIEELGLLKMDFLSLRNLTVIRDCLDYIKKSQNIEINLDEIDYDKEEVYQMISRGETSGVFQLESAGMTQFMKELMPTSLEDIIAGISLYRPGPMDSIPTYIRNKNHPEKITYRHPSLKPILEVTYGCIVYQEQVMQIVRTLGGYSLGQADMVRRAMSKKKEKEMAKERQRFIYGEKDENGNIIIEGAINRGIDEKTASAIFDDMADFAKYAFNKSHAAAYAVIAYQTAYLKCFYKKEYLAALLTSVLGDSSKVARYVDEAKTYNIKVLPPDINYSDYTFTIEEDGIRFGLGAIKNVGKNFVLSIVNERQKGGRFKSFKDFINRMVGADLNKRALEGLIKCGAFDSFASRSQLLLNYEKVLSDAQNKNRENLKGQISMFDLGGENYEKDDFPPAKELSLKEILALEKEAAGIYFSGHPLDDYKDKINKMRVDKISDILEAENHASLDGKEVSILGVINAKKEKVTKSDAYMCFITVEDLTGQIEVIVFPNVYKKSYALISVDSVVVIKGRIDYKEEESPKILASDILAVSDDIEKAAPDLKEPGVYLKLTPQNEGLLDRIHDLVIKNQGDKDFYILYKNKKIKSVYKINPTDGVISSINKIFGADCVYII